jgi:hypothetical protein
MSSSQFGFLASRLVAIYLGYQALQTIIALAATVSVSEPIVLLFSGVNIVVNGALAVFFWFFADAIGKKLAPNNDANTAASGAEIQTAAIVLAGFLFFLKAVPQVSQIVLILTQRFIVADMPFRFSPSELWTSSIEAALYIVAGVILVFSAKCVSNCISKCRGKE